MRRDMKVRVDQVRQFMVDNVTAARDAIYRLAMGIRSTAVDDLLKHFFWRTYNGMIVFVWICHSLTGIVSFRMGL